MSDKASKNRTTRGMTSKLEAEKAKRDQEKEKWEQERARWEQERARWEQERRKLTTEKTGLNATINDLTNDLGNVKLENVKLESASLSANKRAKLSAAQENSIALNSAFKWTLRTFYEMQITIRGLFILREFDDADDLEKILAKFLKYEGKDGKGAHWESHASKALMGYGGNRSQCFLIHIEEGKTQTDGAIICRDFCQGAFPREQPVAEAFEEEALIGGIERLDCLGIVETIFEFTTDAEAQKKKKPEQLLKYCIRALNRRPVGFPVLGVLATPRKVQFFYVEGLVIEHTELEDWTTDSLRLACQMATRSTMVPHHGISGIEGFISISNGAVVYKGEYCPNCHWESERCQTQCQKEACVFKVALKGEEDLIENEIRISSLIHGAGTTPGFTKVVRWKKDVRGVAIVTPLMAGDISQLEKLDFAQVKALFELLETLHKKGVFHNDSRIQNFLFGKDEQIVLSDYGFSSYRGDIYFDFGSAQYRTSAEKRVPSAKGDVGNTMRSLCNRFDLGNSVAFEAKFAGADDSNCYDIAQDRIKSLW